MNTTLATCKHTYDNGGTCDSAAARGRDYCVYHLRYRARLLRMAQLRARNERFDLKLPPLESMFAVQSALTQLAEALAANMIDPKRADKLLAVLRLASRNLLKSDKWPASPYHSDQPGAAVDLAAEYGLPKDLNLDLPPEVAFPSPAEGAPPLSPSFGDRVGAVAGGVPGLSPMPTVAYCKDGPGCPEHTIRADYPITPEMVEIQEITLTQGGDAAVIRGRQLDRNWNRRQLRTDRKRYAAVALQKNLRLAAERLAEEKLAAEKLAAEKAAAAQATGWPIPPSVGGVGTFPDISKKPVASAVTGETVATQEATIA